MLEMDSTSSTVANTYIKKNICFHLTWDVMHNNGKIFAASRGIAESMGHI